MRRLRDIESSSPLMDKVRAMIDATPPVEESRERMLRVRREIERPRGLGASLQRLPALALAGLVVMFGASAFAAVRIWVASAPAPEGAIERPPAHPAARVRAPATVPMPVPLPLPVPVRVPVPEKVEAAQSAPAPVAMVQSERAPSKRALRHAALSRRARRGSARPASAPSKGSATTVLREAAPAQTSAPSKPEPQAVARTEQPEAEARIVTDNERVHRAVKALRRDGNPALAARLLQRVARDTPGPLAEEALSLRIEAALALEDPRTEALAREYIARYPKGRYLRVARRALQEVE